MSETSEVVLSIEEIYARGRVDINFFASLCIPEVCVYELPVFYLGCFQLLMQRNPGQIGKLLRFALGLPRGPCKNNIHQGFNLLDDCL